MNQVYRIFSNVEGFSYLVPKNKESVRIILSLNGSLCETAIPTLEVLQEKHGREGVPLMEGDFFALSQNIICVSDKAYSAIAEPLRGLGDWFDVHSDSKRFKAFHCTNLLNAINVEKCDAEYFLGTNKPMVIRKYVFYPEVIANALLFRNELTPMLDLLCTDQFKQLIEHNHFQGIEFKKLWSK